MNSDIERQQQETHKQQQKQNWHLIPCQTSLIKNIYIVLLARVWRQCHVYRLDSTASGAVLFVADLHVVKTSWRLTAAAWRCTTS
jgi:hypothetical protein